MSRRTRNLLLLAGIAALALFLSGLITGAIGSAFLNPDKKEAGGLLPAPEVHLPPQPIIGAVEHSEGKEVKGLPQSRFFVTNTLLSAWIATALLILLFYLATRRRSMVPRGVQNFTEATIELLYNFVESVAGKEKARRFFPMIATIFLFVVVNAWLGLLPFYQSIGFIKDGHIQRHLLRPAGTDLNMPLALALVSFVFVEYWGLRSQGFHYVGKFFRVQNLLRGRVLQGGIDLFVGALEAFSELIRIVSFSFRLFGNMTAGETLLLISSFLVPFIFSIPFYGLEILVGFVQALIFSGLTLVFVVLAVQPHEAEEAH